MYVWCSYSASSAALSITSSLFSSTLKKILAILIGMQWYLTVISICISLITNNVEHQKPLINYLLNFFSQNFSGLFVFLLISFRSCLYILEPNPWSETYCVNIISQSVAYMFIKLYLEEKNNVFNFMNCTFDVITKKSLQSLISQRFLPIIFFKKSYSINFSI